MISSRHSAAINWLRPALARWVCWRTSRCRGAAKPEALTSWDVEAALDHFRTAQAVVTGLRNAIPLLVRAQPTEQALALAAVVDTGARSSYGLEAERLA